MTTVTVTLRHDVLVDMPDGTTEHIEGILIAMPSERSESGQKYVAFSVDQLSMLNDDTVRQRYVENAAWSLSRFEEPETRWKRSLLEVDYVEAITTALGEALSHA